MRVADLRALQRRSDGVHRAGEQPALLPDRQVPGHAPTRSVGRRVVRLRVRRQRGRLLPPVPNAQRHPVVPAQDHLPRHAALLQEG